MPDCQHIRCEPYRQCQLAGQLPAASDPIDTTNSQMVGRDGTGTICILLPDIAMTRDQALRHAAWLVAIADDNDEFPAILAAVRRSA